MDITLPDLPELVHPGEAASGFPLEDWVASLFQLGRFYVDRGVSYRDGQGWAEYDVAAARFTPGCIDRHVAEVKSGPKDATPQAVMLWLGKLHFFGGASGSWWQWDPVVGDPEKKVDLIERKVPKDVRERLRSSGLDFVTLEDIDAVYAQRQLRGILSEVPPVDIQNTNTDAWRYFYLTDRVLRHLMADFPKPVNRAVQGAWDRVAYKLPMTLDPATRLQSAWTAFEDVGKVEKEARESLIESLAEQACLSKYAAQKKVRSLTLHGGGAGAELEVQRLAWSNAWVRHVLRMATLHAAVEYVASGTDLALARSIHKSMPVRLAEIGKIPFYDRLPQFWQVFTGPWGGWLTHATRERELQDMCQEAGLPYSSAAQALRCWDILFPARNSWLQGVGNFSMYSYHPPPMKALGLYKRGHAKSGRGFALGTRYSDAPPGADAWALDLCDLLNLPKVQFMMT